MNAQPTPTDYRWLKTQHKDLDFWGIAGPVPWPKQMEAKIDERVNFLFDEVREGIRRLLAVKGDGYEYWEVVDTFLERGG